MGTIDPWCSRPTVASTAISRREKDSKRYPLMRLDVRDEGGLRVVVDYKGVWDKCRSGWTQQGSWLCPHGASTPWTHKKASNLQMSHRDKHGSKERGFKGKKGRQSQRIFEGLKRTLLFWL